MVVSHFLSPLRTLKKKKKEARQTTSSASSSSSSSVGDAGNNNDTGNGDEHGPAKDDDGLVAGLCLCCNHKVKYPGSVTCFRCTVCDTINDLQAVERTEKIVAADGAISSRVRALPPPLTLARLRAGIQAYKRHPEKQALLEAMLRESFGSWDVLNVSFPLASAADGLAMDDVHAAYKLILALPPPFIRALMSGIEQLLRRPGRPLRQKSDIRYLLILLENPLLAQQSFAHEASYHQRMVRSIVGTLANLPPHVHYALVLWFSQRGRSALRRKIALVNQFISSRVQKYDRARRRSQALQGQKQLTAYSAQSNQTELPAFQRTRSSTNAPPAAACCASRPAGHTRMRSNTDSRLSLSSHERGIADSARAQLPAASDRAGLGIAAADIGALSLRDATARVATAPGQLLARSTQYMCEGSSNGAKAPPPLPPLPYLRPDGASFESSPALKAAHKADANMTAFVPITSPDLSRTHNAPPSDSAVRLPPRDSVLGVLDGTAEPHSLGAGSLTRTRSSSEAAAPARSHHVPANGTARTTAHSNTLGAVDDYYVGADGVFYPRTSALIMYQHDWRLVAAAKVMALLHAANLLLPTRACLPVEVFYNSAIESMMDLVADYDAWQARTPGAFSFCQYPFLLSLAAKMQIMQVDAARQMDSKLKEAVISALFQSYHMDGARANHPHLKLLVRRHCLVEDSLHQLATHEQDLKKRLKIEFVGEEGVDAGGLTKEWFMLLVRELLNPMYGMFTCEADPEDTASFNSYWFNPASLEASNQYFLVGVVVGLALYNSNILDLQLPLAVFKKLLRTSFYQTHHSLTSSSAAAAASAAASVSPVLSAARPVDVVAKGKASAPGNALTDGLSNGGSHKPRYALASGAKGVVVASTAGSGATNDGRSPIYGLLSASAQLRYQINEMLSDVSQFRPQLAHGLRQLLVYRDDDVEDVFGLTFEVTYDAFGQPVTVPLVPNGPQIPVTSSNRVEYVMRYLQWVLNDSVARQFEPFRRGFYYVCGGNALSLFKPEEIELMVHGSGNDWNPDDLREITEHINFGNGSLLPGQQQMQPSGSQLISWFWQTLKEFTPDDRRMFLSFVTGADRMPTVASGPRLRMRLALLGDDFNRLPVARTCFNQLGIWMYRSKEELKA
ncbi:putative E3 ubiquitin-protein ligase, partial [Coemansia sp. IMI 209127]